VTAKPALSKAVKTVARPAMAKPALVKPAQRSALSSTSDITANAALATALVALQATIVDKNTDALEGMVPSNGTVDLYADGQFQSTLGAADFKQLMGGYSQAAQTTSLSVTAMGANGADASVQIAHTYLDSGMNQVTLFHIYNMKLVGGSYVIRELMVSSSRY
jgi:hypothetical protein